MSFLDIIIGLMLAYGLYKGLKNGLFVEIASLIALIAGIFGAIHFSYIAGRYLSENMQWDERYINLTAFILTFIVIVVVVHLAGKLLTKFAKFALLGTLNNIAGGLFGVLKIAVIIGAILVFFDRVNSSVTLIKNETIESSILYEPVKDIGEFVFSKVLKAKEKVEEKAAVE